MEETEEIYNIQENPVYDPKIRMLKRSDPADAETIFNPLFNKIINNVHYLKLENKKSIEEHNSNLEAHKGMTFPADGGNADTVDGKHSDDFLGKTDYIYSYNTKPDLNEIKTEYHGFVINPKNGPHIFSHGLLDVSYFDGDGFAPTKLNVSTTVVRQVLTIWNSGKIYTRIFLSETDKWTEWTSNTVHKELYEKDFNEITIPGIYTMNSPSANKPPSGSNFGLLVLNYYSEYSTNQYYNTLKTNFKIHQIAFKENSDEIYIRRKYDENNWTGWKLLNDYNNLMNKPTSLPANGGNADTVDGKHASDLQNYNNLTNKPESLPANGGNADTVDGKHASDLQNYNNLTNKPLSLKNPFPLEINMKGIVSKTYSYDGSSSKEITISPTDIGAVGASQLIGTEENPIDFNNYMFYNTVQGIKGNSVNGPENDSTSDYGLINIRTNDDYANTNVQIVFKYFNSVSGIPKIWARSSPIAPWKQICLTEHTHTIGQITNFPSSLPADGGNADTVDGKHASDLQNYNNLTNKPSSLPAKGGTAETISTVLPISKGGTGASTVMNALKNLGMVDSNFNMTSNKPGGSVLIYSGLNAIGITEPKTMREIFNAMSYNTSLCFRTVKSQSACVTDVPLEYAQILCVKGSTENYRYAIAFGCDNDNHDIYYYAEESDGVKINWRKINDGGNADTVDNKHASDFAPNGYGLGTVCAYIPNNDCNDIDSTGFYMGSELINAPNNDNGTNSAAYDYGNNWWYIINLKHRDTYKRQIAFVLQAFNSSKHNSSIFTRICDSVWSKWSRVGGNNYTSTRTFTAAAGNWYRVIGNKGKACGGTFTLTAGISSYSSTTVFAAAQQYTATSNKESKITKLAHSCFNGFITKIRMVSKYSNETYIDVYVGGGSAGEAEISITFNGTGWDIYNDITTANITDGYTEYEIEL